MPPGSRGRAGAEPRLRRTTGAALPSSEGANGAAGSPPDFESFVTDLSLEYDSVWDTKPAWCQPWTILLTGSLAIFLAYSTHLSILTAVVAVLVGAWWFIFLVAYPQAYAEMISERRKRVAEGKEDTYGFVVDSEG
eukprot:SM000193S05181  [mRNA]  locus=s193:111686:113175:- [translate_table: standard]